MDGQARLGTTREDRLTRRRSVSVLLDGRTGLLSYGELAARGITRGQRCAEIAAGRWLALGPRHVVVPADELPTPEEATRLTRWAAVLQVCPNATLDGLSLLQFEGLRGVTGDGLLHVSAPKSSRPRQVEGVRVHETRRWSPEDVVDSEGVRRVKRDVATIRAALWARTDREAALCLVAPVQQRLVSGEALLEAVATVRRHPRRVLIRRVLADVVDGAHSLGELDFAALCRKHGLPEPTRQRVVHGPGGRVYLDVRWDRWGLVVEIDGVHHLDVEPWMADALRQNDVSLRGDTVLRVPVVGLRVMPGAYMGQVRQGLVGAGWRPGA